MFCCIISELITWYPTQLVNSPVFFFRCPLCSRWIGYCISALLGCVCECKAAVLYHIKSITLQLVCPCLPAPICVYTVGNFFTLLRALESPLCFWETEERSLGLSLCPFGSIRTRLNVFRCCSPFPSSLGCKCGCNMFGTCFKQMMGRKRGVEYLLDY